jgi:hypothetical protein
MALIKCPHCGQDVSDKATKCVHCGTSLPLERFCSECGQVVKVDEKVCSNCGNPLSVDENKNTNKLQQVEVTKVRFPKKIIPICLGVITLVIGFIFVSKYFHNSNYSAKMKTVYEKIFKSAVDVETSGNLIQSVWYNAVFEKSDYKTNKYTKSSVDSYSFVGFNTALLSLFNDSTFENDINKIGNDSEEITKIMRDLTNPPDEYKDAYVKLSSCYDSYINFVNLVKSPSGNLSSYTEKINDYDLGVLNSLNALKPYIK